MLVLFGKQIPACNVVVEICMTQNRSTVVESMAPLTFDKHICLNGIQRPMYIYCLPLKQYVSRTLEPV